MLDTSNIPAWPTLLAFVLGAVSAYATLRCFYLTYLHPLSAFPGPRLAAVSNIWYAYHWLSGRYPWVIEDALHKYGDVVRIAPNELVFFTPQAFQDIYATQTKGFLETFAKTDFQDRGDGLGGIVWENDPVRHRQVAKQVAPAFSTRNIRAMEPVVRKHLNFFLEKMRELGAAPRGIELNEWTNWLAMDLALDLAWSEDMGQMKNMRNSVFLDVLLGFNKFATVMAVFKRFPLIFFVQYLFAPLSKLSSLSKMENAVRDGVMKRIERRGALDRVDYFDFVLPIDKPVPTDQRELLHLGSVALQLMFANFGPMADWYYAIILFLVEEPESYRILVAEIRDKFGSAEDITSTALASLPYLHACMEESLRLVPSNNTGLPRYSPGAMVDGHFIPKMTHVQSSVFTFGRSPRYFHEPLKFRPQRWLSPSHPLYDTSFENDHLKSLYPFSLGPRACIGREIAWTQGKLVIASLLWHFNLVKVDGQDFNLERDLLHYGFLEKPKLRVRFVPVGRV